MHRIVTWTSIYQNSILFYFLLLFIVFFPFLSLKQYDNKGSEQDNENGKRVYFWVKQHLVKIYFNDIDLSILFYSN